MSNPPSDRDDIFAVRKIRRLVALMNEHDLSEIDLRQGETRIKLRRGADPVVSYAPPPRPAAAAPAEPKAEAPSAPAAAAPAASDANLLVIKSPMVGTFYKASSPETPPFVKVGDHVSNETVVCI